MEQDVEQNVEETQGEDIGIDLDNTEPEVADLDDDNSEENEDDTNCEENCPEEVQEDKEDGEKDDSDDVDIMSPVFDFDDLKQKSKKGACDDESTAHDAFHLGRVVRNQINQGNYMQSNPGAGTQGHLNGSLLPTLSGFQGIKQFISELGEPQLKGGSTPNLNRPQPNPGYHRSTNQVLAGNHVNMCSTKPFASLSHHNEYIVKERFKDGDKSWCRLRLSEGKTANDLKPKPLPRRSHIVCGNLQYTLVSNLISHPHMDHYFVKERTEIRPSHYLAKLVLRHQYLNRDDVNENTTAVTAAQQSQAAVLAANSAVEKDGAVTERKHFPMNLNMPGFVVFSSDLTRFTGNMKYPLPSRKITATKLGKGGNGFVFAIFHNGKEYAIKKTMYRPVEIRVHSQLSHPNLINLDAVLIGEEHENHKGKFYAFYFMTKCDMDFRSVISTKEHGCLKHLKLQSSNQRDVWQLVMVNVKYVLRSVLKALDYMHKLGLVHRDVKASNILLKMQCHCTKPLMCACLQKYLVKLGDFDSSTTVPGYGLKIEPHQTIRYANVLPLGTMGYRAPEVSMHLVMAGPYEVLYTTAVDIWSFGCLLLNMLIGKPGPLKQRGEASLLLSTQEQPYAESLYTQIIKVKELQKYYGDMPEMVDLVQKCLQVKVHCRPSAKQLLQLDVLQCI